MIDIVTRGTRGLEWLDRCFESLLPLKIDWTWHIVAHPTLIQAIQDRHYGKTIVHRAPTHHGVQDALKSVNYYLDTVPDTGQWWFNLDDDSIMHPRFDWLATILDANDILLFSQEIAPGTVRRIDPQRLGPCEVDMGQFCCRRSAVGPLRFWEIYRGDTYFIQELLARARFGEPQRVGYCLEALAVYNGQRQPFTERP